MEAGKAATGAGAGNSDSGAGIGVAGGAGGGSSGEPEGGKGGTTGEQPQISAGMPFSPSKAFVEEKAEAKGVKVNVSEARSSAFHWPSAVWQQLRTGEADGPGLASVDAKLANDPAAPLEVMARVVTETKVAETKAAEEAASLLDYVLKTYFINDKNKRSKQKDAGDFILTQTCALMDPSASPITTSNSEPKSTSTHTPRAPIVPPLYRIAHLSHIVYRFQPRCAYL